MATAEMHSTYIGPAETRSHMLPELHHHPRRRRSPLTERRSPLYEKPVRHQQPQYTSEVSQVSRPNGCNATLPRYMNPTRSVPADAAPSELARLGHDGSPAHPRSICSKPGHNGCITLLRHALHDQNALQDHLRGKCEARATRGETYRPHPIAMSPRPSANQPRCRACPPPTLAFGPG